MKKAYFSFFFVISVFFLIFISCAQEFDTEKSGSEISSELIGNNNDQGENEGNVKKAPEPDLENKFTYGNGYSFRLTWGGSLVNFPLGIYKDSIPVLISSKIELDELFNETFTQAFDNDAGTWVKTTDFQDILEKYDDEYFSKNELLTYVVSKGGSAFRFELDSVNYEQDILTVGLNYIIPPFGGTAAIEQEFELIEISKIPAETKVEIVMVDRWKQVNVTIQDWAGTYYKL